MNLPERPITILIAALGGEGGGVLADWIIAAATKQNYPVQSTSIPGVAQRTGATTYYIELYPAKIADLGTKRPVLALTPSPSNVDVMVASELIEAGRAMQNGFVSPTRTTLIASTHRIYTTLEKMHMGDGRIDGDRIVKAAESLAKRSVLFDMQAIAQDSGTIINAVLFGALAGSGALPLSRTDCEAAVRGGGRGVEASLKGFDIGYKHAAGELKPIAPEAMKRWLDHPSERVRGSFPVETHRILEEGVARLVGYQDTRYATQYLDRLEPIAKLDRERGGQALGCMLTNETARFLALWMSYEDVIRVADVKISKRRFERVRGEVMAKPGEPVHIVEYLKPGVDELAAMLPTGLANRLVRWTDKRGLTHKLNKGMYIKTTSVFGFGLLRGLAAMRPLRRMTSRWQAEQALIDRWLGDVRSAATRDLQLALEITLCGRLIKGYGETYKRGRGNFLRILDNLVSGSQFATDRDRALAIKSAREAALADPEGRKLEGNLATHGVIPLPPQAKPIKFFRKKPGGEERRPA